MKLLVTDKEVGVVNIDEMLYGILKIEPWRMVCSTNKDGHRIYEDPPYLFT